MGKSAAGPPVLTETDTRRGITTAATTRPGNTTTAIEITIAPAMTIKVIVIAAETKRTDRAKADTIVARRRRARTTTT